MSLPENDYQILRLSDAFYQDYPMRIIPVSRLPRSLQRNRKVFVLRRESSMSAEPETMQNADLRIQEPFVCFA